MKLELKSQNEIIKCSLTGGREMTIKREDRLHPLISGNKYRKLKYNLMVAREQGKNTLVTFGGAFSNHIAATAAAGSEFGFKTVGIIRGEELENKIADNPTLIFAQQCGMKLRFISRQEYRDKSDLRLLSRLTKEYSNCYILPEGGTNTLAIRGCEEILEAKDADFDFVCVPVGTGGTISGLINSAKTKQKILGFPAVKGNFLQGEIKRLVTNRTNWEMIDDYHFGGYGKIKPDLITFINQFREETGIQLDPVYTGKMLFGIMDLIHKGYFKKEDKILIIHTGGLQGIEGMNMKLQEQGLPIIDDK